MAGKDVELEWLPFELRPHPVPQYRPEIELVESWERSTYPVARRFGVPIQLPVNISPYPYMTLPFEGFHYAQERGKGDEYTHLMFQRFFVDNRNIGELSVLGEVAEQIGLDRADFLAALETRRYKAVHEAALRRAQEAGIRSIPTFFIGDEALVGLYDQSTLSRVIDRQLAKQAEAGS